MGCDHLAQQLQQRGVPCRAIHGDKDQRDREKALEGLRSGQIKLLVATDVAARGLDIKGVSLVVNFDVPARTEDYVHRIGRTGRAGQKGFAVLLITERDAHALRSIIPIMERTGQEITAEVRSMARDARPPLSKGFGKGGHRGRSRSRSQRRDLGPPKVAPSLAALAGVTATSAAPIVVQLPALAQSGSLPMGF